MPSIEKLSVELPGSHAVRFMRFLWGAKEPYVLHILMSRNVNRPSFPSFVNILVWVVAGPFFWGIYSILSTRSFTQVSYPVVAFIAVNMVNLLWRPPAVYYKPRQSVRFPLAPQEIDNAVPGGIDVASPLSCPLRVPVVAPMLVNEPFNGADLPRKDPGIRVIVQQLAYLIGVGQRVLSHRVSLIQRQWSEALSCRKQAAPRFNILAFVEA
jgi:hypothetical protein